MLVINRREGQEVIIDGRIRVVIVSMGRSSVRVGIDAPNDVVVDRLEIHELKQQQEQNNGA